jgi:hypothetical protein
MSFLLVANIGRRDFGWFSRECLASKEARLGSVASLVPIRLVGGSSVAVVWWFFLMWRMPCTGDGFFIPPPLSLPSFSSSSLLIFASVASVFGSPTLPRHSGPSPMSSS